MPATLYWERDGKEMVLVPAGEFVMGSTEGHLGTLRDEKPQHTVYLDAFYIDKTEVTNAEYKRFVDATGHRPPDHWTDGRIPVGLASHPVVYVSWEDAAAYAAWVGKRLPTEAEWEKAARGTDQRIYPWGNEWDPAKANVSGGLGRTMPVGNYPAGASPYGCLDMAGNVCEWCADWYDEGYYAQSPAYNPRGPISGATKRVWRGGAFGYSAGLVRCAYRSGSYYLYKCELLGFRLVISPIPPIEP